MRTLRVTFAANEDLQYIQDRIARDNPSAAVRLIERFEARMELICSAPDAGEPRDDVSPGIRQAIIGSYVIYYRAEQDVVSILRVVHGARDMPGAFFEK
jgi:toxin ParE1/3/4